MWQKALDRMLRTMLRHGSLIVEMPDGQRQRFGDGSGTSLTVQLHDAATVRQLVINPELALGEAYMNGTLTIDDDDVQGLLALIIQNMHAAPRVWWQQPLLKLRSASRRFAQNNIAPKAQRNVAHHYDLSGRLYDQFLDADLQYSCAYFRDPGDTLETAQAQKKDHIARKLMLEPGMRVLDIGCGWGGMALSLARDHGARVLGITLSEEQHARATARAAREGLSDQVEFRLTDYRDVAGTFDRIVSIGMFEHVGLPHYSAFFDTIRDRLSPDGVALVHTIGWIGPSQATNPWIAKYIFPGGYIPKLSETTEAIENSKLWTTDIECLRLHYAYTLRHWFDRFTQNEDEVRTLYDTRFVKMWRFYLAACEQTFRHGPQAVFQFQLSRKIDAVPLTREYLYQPPHRSAIQRAAE
ncbi:cyclopropane-fatty-acyl-phospholipid synthase [Rhodobacteraceae bacterium KMM 6894]|nr:cyclopropane-fatty-acyl-phospholipid synthase [Rhodobacteraceae bacterium KMM 6894]